MKRKVKILVPLLLVVLVVGLLSSSYVDWQCRGSEVEKCMCYLHLKEDDLDPE